VAMGHNSRFRAGPTLKECEDQGAAHLEIRCLRSACAHTARAEISKLGAPRDVPVNKLGWRCQKCKGINVAVAVVKPDQPVTPEPVFQVGDVRPKPRRRGCGKTPR